MSADALSPMRSPTDTNASAVILFSHGSLLCGSGATLDAHAARLRQMAGFAQVEVGYLNYSSPPFAEAVEKVTSRGAVSIVVVPYFLAPGYFVTTSLPKMLAEVAPQFPGVTFTIAAPIGYDDDLAAAVIAAAMESRPSEHWRDGLNAAAKACLMRRDCPIYGEPGCRAAVPVEGTPSAKATPRSDEASVHANPNNNAGKFVNASLLVLAHGSPKAEANLPMLDVVDYVRQTSDAFRSIEVGYLECNQPNIAQAIDLCAEAEPSVIVTVPYFLHMGTHVASDLPDALDDGRARYPHITFEMGEFLGNMPQVTEVLAKRAREASTAGVP